MDEYQAHVWTQIVYLGCLEFWAIVWMVLT